MHSALIGEADSLLLNSSKKKTIALRFIVRALSFMGSDPDLTPNFANLRKLKILVRHKDFS
jgi:hypothetical protein